MNTKTINLYEQLAEQMINDDTWDALLTGKLDDRFEEMDEQVLKRLEVEFFETIKINTTHNKF